MKSKTVGAAAVAAVAAMAMAGTALAADTMLDPFTQTELDSGWDAELTQLTFPSDGVTSVTAFGRTNVARIGVDHENPTTAGDTTGVLRNEGIITVPPRDFGLAVQVDLYVDPAWENHATQVGVRVYGDDGGFRSGWVGGIEFVNSDGYTGWRTLSAAEGPQPVATPVAYGQWVTLSITLDPTGGDNYEYTGGEYSYAIDGVHVGEAAGPETHIREVLLNHFNFGGLQMPIDIASYAAYWHAGLTEIDSKDQCRDGRWEASGFKNQGQCIKFVNTGQDSR
ncbi:MAG TPA: hypothetical protein VMM60_11575 [Ilumatobacter sp.]|nr:hypothetical protein [Ilumatobacter sp.]